MATAQTNPTYFPSQANPRPPGKFKEGLLVLLVMKESGVELTPRLRSRYEFSPDVLEVIITGRSMIDVVDGWGGLPLKTHSDVSRYLASYGFDLDDPITHAELLGNLREAIEFIRTHFLQPENPEGLKLEIPRKLIELTDIRDLFLLANRTYPGQQSDLAGTGLKNWACSVLKVMHTIAHVDKDLRAPYFPEIQKQILDRYYKVIHRNSQGELFLAEREESLPQDRIELVSFETKPKKSRNSILLKLLHKPENVAEEVFDRVGIRFITKTRLDALKVIRFLREQTIVVPANLKPSRSKNSLIDIPFFKEGMEKLLREVEEGQVDELILRQSMDHLIQDPIKRENNPFSGETYRAIQFTCRQLITVRNPMYDEVRSLRRFSKDTSVSENLRSALERIDMKHIQRETRFFYPYEVQVTDELSHSENEKGRSAHSSYKKAQTANALERVMRGFLA